MRSHRHPAVPLVAGLVAGLAVGACGEPAPSTVAPPVAAPQSTPPASAPADGEVTEAGTATTSSARVTGLERDPAVRALRRYYVGFAKGVNARSGDVPDLRKASTRARAERNEQLMSPDFGLRAPGPIPFTPLSVRALDARTREVAFCVVDEGWAREPDTGRPARPRSVIAATATVLREDGAWRVDVIMRTRGSCDGVPIQEVTW